MRSLLLLLLSAGLCAVLACGSGDEDDFELPDLTPFPPDILTRLHEIRDVAARVRGLEVNPDVEEGVISREDWQALVDEEYANLSDEDQEQIELSIRVLRLLQMIGPEDDYLEIASTFSGNQVLAFYHHEEKKIVFLNVDALEDISMSAESTFAHEYTHSFQQRWLESDEIEKLAEDDSAEYSTTVSCVIEGDAGTLERYYLQEVYGDDWFRLLLEEAFAEEIAARAAENEEAEEEVEIPPALQRAFVFNYNECPAFVRAIRAELGWEGVNALYDDLPSTTEQIMHPRKYLDGEAALPVEAIELEDELGGKWEEWDRGVFGEFDVYNYLLTLSEHRRASKEGAEGWGGGLVVFYTDASEGSEGALVQITLLWDSPREYREFRTAYLYALDRLAGDALELGDRETTWSHGGASGVVFWTEDSARSDIVIANDEAALETATARVREALAQLE